MKDVDWADRIGFIRKVYLIVAAQLLLTAVGVVTVVYSVKDQCNPNYSCTPTMGIAGWMWDNVWLEIVALIVAIIVEIAIICARHLARKVPINYALLFVFTVCQAYAISCSCIYYASSSPGTVMQAFIGTAMVTVACTLYAFTTKNDFTYRGGFIWVLCMALLMLVLFSTILVWEGDTFAYNCIIALCVVILGMFLIHDT